MSFNKLHVVIRPMMVLSSAGSCVMCLSLPVQGQRFFLELFSGAGLVAAAASSRGILAFGFDRKNGWDLARDDVIQCMPPFVSCAGGQPGSPDK